jgi:hypothetical protein
MLGLDSLRSNDFEFCLVSHFQGTMSRGERGRFTRGEQEDIDEDGWWSGQEYLEGKCSLMINYEIVHYVPQARRRCIQDIGVSS